MRVKIWESALAGNTIRPFIHEDDLKLIAELLTELVRPDVHRFSLLRVCRQIYTETAILPYALSTFTLLRQEYIDDWLEAMSPSQIALVQNCRKLHFGYADLDSLALIPGRFQRLKVMEVELDIQSNGYMEYKEKVKFEKSYGVPLETTYSFHCDWINQWAECDPDARCKTCHE